jgi:hypothetical protein
MMKYKLYKNHKPYYFFREFRTTNNMYALKYKEIKACEENSYIIYNY